MKTWLHLEAIGIHQESDCSRPRPRTTDAVSKPSHRPKKPKPQMTGALENLAVAALVLLAGSALAQTWSTVDDFQYSLGTNSFATGLAKDPTGTILYAAGDGVDGSGVYHAVAFQSRDAGNTWSLMDDYADPTSPPGDGFGYDAGIATDPSGNIYASGYGPATGGRIVWFTRRSADGGVTWLTADAITNATPGANEMPAALTSDNSGNIYVVGHISSAWIVRKGTAGTSWATVDSLVSAYGGCAASSVFCHPTAGVFVVGTSTVPSKNGRGQRAWTVRRSQDNGATWTTVDAYVVTGTEAALGVGADTKGNLYVIGHSAWSYRGSTYGSWLVRKSADGGNTWVIVDNYQPSPAATATPSAFGCDASGNIFVVGGSGNYWLVRESSNGGGSWQNVDSFQSVSGMKAQANAVICNSSNNVFVAGYANDAANVQHWIVRKR